MTDAVKRNDRGRILWTANKMIPRDATSAATTTSRNTIGAYSRSHV